MKKDLIVISAYCPTQSKEIKLEALVDKIQSLRENFDILVVSHSPLDKKIQEKIEHFYYDSYNEILHDFDLCYVAWFENQHFMIETPFVYNMTTAVAITRQIRYSINFANFWGYKKIHYMEYDFIYPGDDFIIQNNKYLDNYDTVMVNHPLKDGPMASSVYFSFITRGLEEDSKEFNRDAFLDIIRNYNNISLDVGKGLMTSHGRMTENLNVILFTQNKRTILYLPSSGLDQTEDSHGDTYPKWAFPIYDKVNNQIMFFSHNTKENIMSVEVKLNNQSFLFFELPPHIWNLNYLSDIEGDKIIEIWVDGIFQKKIEINSSNREKFKNNSTIRYTN